MNEHIQAIIDTIANLEQQNNLLQNRVKDLEAHIAQLEQFDHPAEQYAQRLIAENKAYEEQVEGLLQEIKSLRHKLYGEQPPLVPLSIVNATKELVKEYKRHWHLAIPGDQTESLYLADRLFGCGFLTNDTDTTDTSPPTHYYTISKAGLEWIAQHMPEVTA